MRFSSDAPAYRNGSDRLIDHALVYVSLAGNRLY